MSAHLQQDGVQDVRDGHVGPRLEFPVTVEPGARVQHHWGWGRAVTTHQGRTGPWAPHVGWTLQNTHQGRDAPGVRLPLTILAM